MDQASAEARAQGVLRQWLQRHQHELDEPVVEYLSSLLASAADSHDDAQVDNLMDVWRQFLGPHLVGLKPQLQAMLQFIHAPHASDAAEMVCQQPIKPDPVAKSAATAPASSLRAAAAAFVPQAVITAACTAPDSALAYASDAEGSAPIQAGHGTPENGLPQTGLQDNQVSDNAATTWGGGKSHAVSHPSSAVQTMHGHAASEYCMDDITMLTEAWHEERGYDLGSWMEESTGDGAWHDDGCTLGDMADMGMTPDDASNILGIWFPSYSRDVLLQLLATYNNDVYACYDELDLVEQGCIGTAANDSWEHFTDPQQPLLLQQQEAVSGFSLDAQAFPALATPASPSLGLKAACNQHSQTPTHNYAAVAAKAAHAKTQQHPARSAQAVKAHAAGAGATAVGSTAVRNHKEVVSVVPWVQTGEAVREEYEQARSEARDHARLRNACFQQATMAYLAGNKAAAKELSAKGRKHAEAMRAAHAAAAQRIFQSRNRHVVQQRQQPQQQQHSDVVFLDLHGLHVSEARSLLTQQLQQLRFPAATAGAGKGSRSHMGSSNHRLQILVGTGHHTKGSRTPMRLPAAVQQLLDERQVKWREVQPGLLEAWL